MNVETMTVGPNEAREQFKRYCKAVREGRERRRFEIELKAREAGLALNEVRVAKTLMEREDEQLKVIYRHLLKGERVICLSSVLRNAGLNEAQKLPVLAIAEADAQWCRLSVRQHDVQHAYCFFDERVSSWPSREKQHRLFFSRNVFPAELWDQTWRSKHNYTTQIVRAAVPAIPPHLRPADPSEYHILWEAVWAPSPPVDPILLKRITHDHFVVVAQWDLTEVERSVLAGRFSDG